MPAPTRLLVRLARFSLLTGLLVVGLPSGAGALGRAPNRPASYAAAQAHHAHADDSSGPGSDAYRAGYRDGYEAGVAAEVRSQQYFLCKQNAVHGIAELFRCVPNRVREPVQIVLCVRRGGDASVRAADQFYLCESRTPYVPRRPFVCASLPPRDPDRRVQDEGQNDVQRREDVQRALDDFLLCVPIASVTALYPPTPPPAPRPMPTATALHAYRP
jgi:hypothetical protein